MTEPKHAAFNPPTFSTLPGAFSPRSSMFLCAEFLTRVPVVSSAPLVLESVTRRGFGDALRGLGLPDPCEPPVAWETPSDHTLSASVDRSFYPAEQLVLSWLDREDVEVTSSCLPRPIWLRRPGTDCTLVGLVSRVVQAPATSSVGLCAALYLGRGGLPVVSPLANPHPEYRLRPLWCGPYVDLSSIGLDPESLVGFVIERA